MYANGDKYEGEWSNDLRHGYGIFTAQSGETYSGMWKHGHKEGKGKLLLPNSAWIQGEWKNNKINGPVVFHFADNSPWIGPDY
jgi:hypothetical protein